jgi:hypothetical protein
MPATAKWWGVDPLDPVASLEAATAPAPGTITDNSSPNGKPRNRPKHLQVVK